MEETPDPLELVRARIQHTIRTFVTGSAAPPRRLAPRDHPGLFGPDSVTWHVLLDSNTGPSAALRMPP